MGAVAEWQRWLYGDAIAALETLQSAGFDHLPVLVGTAFLFGLLHAFLPGHGKALLAAHYAGRGDWRDAVLSSGLVIVVHVGSAIVLVLAGFAVIQRTIGGAGRAPAIERLSAALIVAIGIWMLWRAFRPHAHEREHSGPILALAAGLVPCPLTTFIMTYAVVNGAVAAGLFLSGAFALGMIVTVVAFPLIAIFVRSRLLAGLDRAIGPGSRGGLVIAATSAVVVIALGLWPLVRHVPR